MEAAVGDNKGNSSTSSLSSAPPSPSTEKTIPVVGNSSSQVESSDSVPSPSTTRKQRGATKKTASAKTMVAKRAARKKKWDAENLLSDPKSILAKADLRSLLADHPIAWDVLNAEEKAEVLALFPDKEHILNPDSVDARPNFTSLMNDDTFRHECTAYTENISMGRFDPGWLASAWSAHERRKMGDFDEHLVNKFQNDWSVDLPEDFKPKRQVSDPKGNENNPTTEEKKTEEPEPKTKSNGVEPKDEIVVQQKEHNQEDDPMSVDELQAESSQPTEQATPSAWKNRRESRMDLDTNQDDDELAWHTPGV